MKKYYIFSSWGSLTIDESGNVLDRNIEGNDTESLESVVATAVRFNIEEYLLWIDTEPAPIREWLQKKDIDILDIGFWDADGLYVEPEESHRMFYTSED